MKLPEAVTLREIKPGFPVLEVSHDLCTGSVALLGAYVMEWTPAGKKPVLFMSADAVFEEGQPIRGGIPVCWPWFGGREALPC
jgi:glucose-6-phosphate 1-epimerase